MNNYGTDPSLSHTDGDGLSDGKEVNVYHSNPLSVDSDGGGRDDGVEVQVDETNPAQSDDDVKVITSPLRLNDGGGFGWTTLTRTWAVNARRAESMAGVSGLWRLS